MAVPTTQSLNTIYSQDAIHTQQARWNNLLQSFKREFGHLPGFVSRSPGRVNIIGEHIDYSLYEVIPMAVEADVLLAVSVHTKEEGPTTIRLVNKHSEKFKSQSFEISEAGNIDIDSSKLDWTNYFKSGLRGAIELLQKSQPSFKQSVGMNVYADGSVPAGGGLSSSAAFVCASALAVLRANGIEQVDKQELVEVAIVSERSVGVNSGGMDQAASVFPLQGSALYVSFVPELAVKNIDFPDTEPALVFVIAQTFVSADKHVTGPVCYNLRVVECTLAALVLARIFGLKDLAKDSSPLGHSLRSFHDRYFEEKEGIANNHHTSKADLQLQLQDLLEKVDSYLPQEEGYTREQISDILGISISELEETYMKKFPVRAEYFKLRQRAQHVFSEAARVLHFMELLSAESPNSIGESKILLENLGDLMNKTQDSCRFLYECSCPELDELCDLARSAGAYGSRLTGAGWGGCSVHLVSADKVDAVKQKWIDQYYRKRFPDMSDEQLHEAIVVSKPGSGSALFDVANRESI